jgi:hypothetical protein
MTLESNSIKRNAGGGEILGEGGEHTRLGTRILEVVVVDVQSCGWVGSSGGPESGGDEVRAGDAVERCITPDAGVVEKLICNVP